MHFIAPLVLLLGLTGALYKTQEVWPLVEYNVMLKKPYFAGQISATAARTKMLAEIKRNPERGKYKEPASASGGGASTI